MYSTLLVASTFLTILLQRDVFPAPFAISTRHQMGFPTSAKFWAFHVITNHQVLGQLRVFFCLISSKAQKHDDGIMSVFPSRVFYPLCSWKSRDNHSSGSESHTLSRRPKGLRWEEQKQAQGGMARNDAAHKSAGERQGS